jgi:DNA-binding beta-propeller fold protein YncE
MMTRLLPAGLVALALAPMQNAAPSLRPAGSIALPGVEGRFDHFSVDLENRRLFVAALGNNTVEAIDLKSNTLLKSLSGFQEPQGLRYLPDTRRLIVANGGNGVATVVDGGTLTPTTQTRLSGDADNVRYDAKNRRVYVGYAGGALAVLDDAGRHLSDIALAGHPESFQLEVNGPRIFVNVPSAGQIAVIDRDKRSVVATWPVTQARANYPMALDETHHRLLIGCRTPARLLVYDTTSGTLVTSADIVGDTDDLFLDDVAHRVYVAGGEGFITVLDQADPDHYRVVERIQTAPGARTALFVPELDRLFLAVPHRGAQRAEIRIFATSGIEEIRRAR